MAFRGPCPVPKGAVRVSPIAHDSTCLFSSAEANGEHSRAKEHQKEDGQKVTHGSCFALRSRLTGTGRVTDHRSWCVETKQELRRACPGDLTDFLLLFSMLLTHASSTVPCNSILAPLFSYLHLMSQHSFEQGYLVNLDWLHTMLSSSWRRG